MQAPIGNAVFTNWRFRCLRRLPFFWKEALLVAILAFLGASAAAFTKMPGYFAGDVPFLMDNICRGSATT
jgi:hypothetical protein